MSEKKRIVLVEDDPDLVESMRLVLVSKQYEVSAAFDTVSGLEKIRKEKPDLVIMDVMFGSDEHTLGFDLAVSVRKDPGISRTPILMVTAVNSKMKNFEFSPETDGDYLPVDGFLDKPVQPKELLEKVSELLGKKVNSR
jgi:DNA-binding response OmpR family regulator